MLEGALQHRHKSRLDAGSLMKGEFSQFHTELSKEADTVPEMLSSKSRRTTSVVLEGSVKRHNAYLGYQKFERSLTTSGCDLCSSVCYISRLTDSEISAVLATILTNQTVKKLLSLIERMNQKKSASIVSNCQSNSSSEKNEGSPSEVVPVEGNAEKLKVATIKELMSVLTSMEMVDERERDDVLKMIQGLRGYMFYETFAYHVASLQQLINEKESRSTDETCSTCRFMGAVLSNALFIHSSDRSVSPVKSHPWLLQERIAPTPSPGSNQQVAPTPSPGSNQRVAPTKRGGTGASRPLRVHTSIEDRPVHNIGSDGLSPHLNVVANRKQSNLFVCIILRWVRPLTHTVPLDSPGSVNPCHPARG
ncbi:hypothetical protein THAOC_06157 [Thalassiosira oceanica]|uniref:Uncharacterized protein n=1 Tax=Thalassiosira oceanica TaxID=159749 RepID=K0T124_THAOC|nr:hypothetical protein THAOC_06157 [Thalassiosira oceanica]|eukprot:EJK72323.1 hypothetical protein THAOC_06157 [Thalassiosira oceanica]